MRAAALLFLLAFVTGARIVSAESYTAEFLPREPALRKENPNGSSLTQWSSFEFGFWVDSKENTTSLLVADDNGDSRLRKFKVPNAKLEGSRVLRISGNGELFFSAWYNETKKTRRIRHIVVTKVNLDDSTSEVLHLESNGDDRSRPIDAIMLDSQPNVGTVIAVRQDPPTARPIVTLYFIPAGSTERKILSQDTLNDDEQILRMGVVLQENRSVALVYSTYDTTEGRRTVIRTGRVGESLTSIETDTPDPAYIVAANTSRFYLSSVKHNEGFGKPETWDVVPYTYDGKREASFKVATKEPGFVRYAADSGDLIVGYRTPASYYATYGVQAPDGKLKILGCKKKDGKVLDVELLGMRSDGSLVAYFPYFMRTAYLKVADAKASEEVTCSLE